MKKFQVFGFLAGIFSVLATIYHTHSMMEIAKNSEEISHHFARLAIWGITAMLLLWAFFPTRENFEEWRQRSHSSLPWGKFFLFLILAGLCFGWAFVWPWPSITSILMALGGTFCLLQTLIPGREILRDFRRRLKTADDKKFEEFQKDFLNSK